MSEKKKRFKTTNSNHIKQIIWAELMRDIEDEAGCSLYGDEAAHRAFYMFKCVDTAYEQNRTPSHKERVADWLQGLPLNIPFENHTIIKWAEEMHEITLTDKEVATVLDRYWGLMAHKLIQLWESVGDRIESGRML